MKAIILLLAAASIPFIYITMHQALYIMCAALGF